MNESTPSRTTPPQAAKSPRRWLDVKRARETGAATVIIGVLLRSVSALGNLFLLHQLLDRGFDLLIAAAGHDLGFVGDTHVRLRLIVLAAFAVQGSPASHRNPETQSRVDLVFPPDERSGSRHRHPDQLPDFLAL